MRAALPLLFAAARGARAAPPDSAGGGNGTADGDGSVDTRTVPVGGVQRTYHVWRPQRGNGTAGGEAAAPRLPVILSFHWWCGTARQQAGSDGLRAAAGHAAVVVHPEGRTDTADGTPCQSWNGGGSAERGVGPGAPVVAPLGATCVPSARYFSNLCYSSCLTGGATKCGECWWTTCADDVGFVAALLDDLSTAYAVDTDRVYATGLSNGAVFLYQLAQDPRTAGRIAAIAPVAGLPFRGFNFPLPSPMRYLNIAGRNDPYVPPAAADGVAGESYSKSYGWYYSSLANTSRSFAARLGAPAGEAPVALRAAAKGSAECTGWPAAGGAAAARSPGVAAARVASCVWGGGHAWPSFATQLVTEFFLGDGAGPEAAGGGFRAGACGRGAPGGCGSCGWDAEFAIGGPTHWRDDDALCAAAPGSAR